ncbi:MAG: hypothetical protein QM704_04550 [Anaeromyxobacteraceae bacterium]
MTVLVPALIALTLAGEPAEAPKVKAPAADLEAKPALRPLSEQDRRLREAALRQAAAQAAGPPRETREQRQLRGKSALLVAGGLALLGGLAMVDSRRQQDPAGRGLDVFAAYGAWAFAGGAGLYGGWLLATDPPGPTAPPP